jgi:hypothetical protein
VLGDLLDRSLNHFLDALLNVNLTFLIDMVHIVAKLGGVRLAGGCDIELEAVAVLKLIGRAHDSLCFLLADCLVFRPFKQILTVRLV